MIVFLLGCIGLVGVMVLDSLYSSRGFLGEGWPHFYAKHIARSAIIFVSVIAMLGSLFGSSRPKMRLDESTTVPFEQLSILSGLVISVAILFLFIFKPSTFSSLSLEDGIIEWGSAVLLFGSSIVMIISFLKIRGASNITRSAQLTTAFLSVVFFLTAMEGVSWFQRVFEVDTPKILDSNIQHEMNLHNFATHLVENVYYFGAFFFLVLLPFLRLLFSYISNNSYLKMFVGRPFIAVLGSIACSYNFSNWNTIFTQIAFFGSVIILFAFFVLASYRNEKYIILSAIALVVANQGLFLANGANFTQLWEVKEYKEFFIPLALFVYSLNVFTDIKQARLSGKS